jgi:hypothetical protein
MKTKLIEQLNATPAAGKTREARRLMEKHINDKKATNLIVYAAPTRVLLEEVLSALEASTSVTEKIEDMVVYLRGKHVVKQYAYAMRMIDRQEAAKFLTPLELETLESKLYKVVLCTHECITRAPNVVTERASKTFVIFDEARQCVLEDLEVKVTAEELASIKGNFQLRKQNTEVEEEVLMGGVPHRSTLYSVDADGFPSTQKLMAAFSAVTFEELPKVARQLHRMKKVCTGGRADILIEVLEPKDSKKHMAHIVGVARPSSIFEGYGRVLVMSAYFEHSQMYHLLKNAHVGHQRGGSMFELVEYRASSNFKEASRKITANSLKNIRIGSLLAGDKAKTLTASMLSSGLIIPIKLSDILQAASASGKKLPKKDEIQSAAFLNTVVRGIGKEGNAMLHESGNPPLLELRRIAYRVLKRNRVSRALCFVNAFGGGSTGSKYSVGGVKNKRLKVADFLHNLPGSLSNDAYKTERSFFTHSMLQHLGETAMDSAPEAVTVNEGYFRTPASTSVLGLNSYAGYHAFVHLAALNPKPWVARVLQRIMPGYEPSIDYAISNIIQTMYRTSLRVADSKVPVYCLVMSEWIIEKIERICFAGEKLQRIKYQPEHTILGQTVNVEQKQKAGRGKRKYSEETGKKINKVRASLRQARNAKQPNQETIKRWENELSRVYDQEKGI